MPVSSGVSPRRMPAKQHEKAPQPQKAIKYKYDPFIEEWTSEECVVMIARKPFAEGGMRWCYKMYEIDKNGKHAPGVAKIFKEEALEDEEPDDISKAYFDEAMTQTVADSFAQQYNAFLGDDPENEHLKCRFLPVRVMQFYGKSGPHSLCNAEPYLQGNYVKHNDNDGHVETTQEVPQAFSHFTWEFSNQAILVCDIQGVGNFFTDPQIHSHDGESFGMGNLGEDGMKRFFDSHRCNSLCRKLGLVKPEKGKDGSWRVGKNSVVKSRTPKSLHRSDSEESAGAGWTAKKYDGAMTQAITRVTKQRTLKAEEQSTDPVQIPQQQLQILQAKLVMLIQQHGSMNQLLLSPTREPRKPPPNERVEQRPWSPDRNLGDRGSVSPFREGAQSPLHLQMSPRARAHASCTGKISSSYDFDEPLPNANAALEGANGATGHRGMLRVPSSDHAGPALARMRLQHQASSPALMQMIENDAMAKKDSRCKYCGLKGTAQHVMEQGPQHDRLCKRWADRPILRRSDTMPAAMDLDNSVGAAGKSHSPGGKRASEAEKKEMLHMQMLDLRRQLEEQLQRLQQKELLTSSASGNPTGLTTPGGGNGGSKDSGVAYDRP